MAEIDHTASGRKPAAEPGSAQERFNVPGAEILSEDTWGSDAETCPECGRDVDPSDSRCRACGQWLDRCSGSCPSCASPRCVGEKRPTQR